MFTPQTSLKMDCALAISFKILTLERTSTKVQNKSKVIDLAIRMELTRSILLPQLSGLLSNSNIHFRMCFYLVTYFPRVTVWLLWRSQARTISSPFN